MKALPKFYIVKRRGSDGKIKENNCTIKMVLTIPAGRVEYYTGIKVDAKYFVDDYVSKRKQPIKPNAPFADDFNHRLNVLYNKAISIINSSIASGEFLTVKEFKSRIDNLGKTNKPAQKKTSVIPYIDLIYKERTSGVRLKPNGSPFSESANNKLKTVKKALQSFVEATKRSDLYIEDLDDDFHKDFKEYLSSIRKNIKAGTYGNYVSTIKAIIQDAISDGIISNAPVNTKKFINTKETRDVVCLSKEQLDILFDFKFNKDTVDRTIFSAKMYNSPMFFKKLEIVRDLFLIGCYSALRYSDLNKFSIEGITPQFMRVLQRKTKQKVTIPVSSKMQAILSKYNNNIPRIPFSRLQTYNMWLRKLMQTVGFKHDVVVKEYTLNGTVYKTVPFYNLVSSHTARRTYATIMFLSGVPTLLIMAVTGHRTEASFLKYIRATNEDKARLMAEYMEKLNF